MKADKTLTGLVITKKVNIGSKSEHMAVCLETGNKTYQLRRAGGNPFFDEELQAFIGKKIKGTGIIEDSLFIANDIKEV